MRRKVSANRISDMSKLEKKVAVIGAGSWGTALSVRLSESVSRVSLWVRRQEAATEMKATRRNPGYLSDADIPNSVHITHDLESAVADAEVWVIATPSQAIRGVAKLLRPYMRPEILVVSVAKGIENNTLERTTQILAEVLDEIPAGNIGVLYGPSHAEEVMSAMPTTVVVSFPTEEIAEMVQQVFMSRVLRVYVNTDVLGVEIAGSVKNVMAIAAGISDGLGFGDNAKAAILTRGMAEMRRLGIAMGAHPDTFAGLAGIGDLVVTCMSRHSRNRYLGEQIGRGRTLQDIESEMNMVAEGVATTRSVRSLAEKYHVEMPITEAVYALLFENRDPNEVVGELMSRAARSEMEWLDPHDDSVVAT